MKKIIAIILVLAVLAVLGSYFLFFQESESTNQNTNITNENINISTENREYELVEFNNLLTAVMATLNDCISDDHAPDYECINNLEIETLDTSDWEYYENKEYGISYKYPKKIYYKDLDDYITIDNSYYDFKDDGYIKINLRQMGLGDGLMTLIIRDNDSIENHINSSLNYSSSYYQGNKIIIGCRDNLCRHIMWQEDDKYYGLAGSFGIHTDAFYQPLNIINTIISTIEIK
jgi:hypothetical protein